MEIIDVLVELRKEKNIKQKNLADALNMSRSNLSDIENKKTRLTIEVFLSICKFLNVDPINLVKNKDDVIVSISRAEADLISTLNQKIQNSFIQKSDFEDHILIEIKK